MLSLLLTDAKASKPVPERGISGRKESDMKKVINRKMYDTDTAMFIGSYDSTESCTDIGWYCETLYQKRTGEFFLLGEGGAASPYAQDTFSGGTSSGAKIIPLSYSQAQDWAEKHLSAEQYCSVFGDPEYNNEVKMLGIEVSAYAAAKLRKFAAMHGITQREQLERWIADVK